MKRCLIFVLSVLAFAPAFAAPSFLESPVADAGSVPGGATPDLEAVALTTYSWSQVPNQANVNANRNFVFIVNYATNNATQKFIFSNSKTTPTISVGLCYFELQAGEWFAGNVEPSVYIYGKSDHTAAENVVGGEGFFRK